MILAIIIACEIGFWLFLLAGLVARYPLAKPRLGAGLLICAPLVDLVLLIAIVIDLRSGTTTNWMHGLAALYIGVSVGFGHRLINFADEWFLYFTKHGPRPHMNPHEKVANARRNLVRMTVAGLISAGLLGGAILLVDDPERSAASAQWLRTVAVITGISYAIDLYDIIIKPVTKSSRLSSPGRHD